ncbi:hypothetical protein ASPBRDRAFT_60313 [Aspergillus brasiliensis CBS 101740]|uniref:HNH nuclease domain-containing protein n=1 Tax=Aspergillus brasiliensis (strain CBS 101740 / IMI 381727 / IBT 21946) TaxID=767769 RepID=A0A1L9U2E6_ASPBC|nr:hypothetical protein ASPBRDRAFT_60313 [Aspergillus brasiliensis CBS 101740]
MALPLCVRRHLSSLEGVIERDLAIRIFDAIMLQFESSQPTDCAYYPVTLIRLMRDEFLSFFFIQQDLLDEYDERIGLGQVLSQLAPFPHLPSDFVEFAKYLVDNFLLPLQALAGKTPQPTPALSRSTTADVAIGTPQRVSNLHKSCLIRDRYRFVITGRFDAQEAQTRYKRDGRDVKDDDGKPLLPERDTMAYLEVAHNTPLAQTELFGNFEIAFEPVGTQPHSYKVDYVESDPMGRVEKLPVTVGLFLAPDCSVDPPSPQLKLLAIHSVIGRILHLSAAGEYINDYIRGLEEMKGGEVMHDGSTCPDDYVWYRLRETSVY